MAKTVKSSFAARVAEAHEQHKGDETRVGSGGDLPAGIEGGIARLVDCKIGVYQKGDNEGEPFFMAAGTVLDPESVTVIDPKTKKARVIPVQGLRTQIGPEPLCDTVAQNGNATSLADHWDRMLNHLRLLGIDTKEIEPTDIVAEPEEGKFETGPILQALVQAAPTFRFRTWQGKATPQFPNPRVNHEWRGLCNYDETVTDDVQDDTANQARWESDAAAEEAAKEAEPEKPKTPVKEPPKPKEAPEAPEEPDYMALGKLADAGKPKKAAEEAARTLAGHAKLFNIDHDAAPSWENVAEQIVAHKEEPEAVAEESAEETFEEAPAEEEFTEEPEIWTPAVGEIGFFHAPKSKEPVQCQFTEVDAKAEKVTLKRLDKNTLVKGVPFKLLSADGIPF